jgi:hypothetical protein
MCYENVVWYLNYEVMIVCCWDSALTRLVQPQLSHSSGSNVRTVEHTRSTVSSGNVHERNLGLEDQYTT